MTFDDICKLGGFKKWEPDPAMEVVPPGGISLREAMRMVASGRATLAPTGVAIITADGVHYRQREGETGLMPVDSVEGKS